MDIRMDLSQLVRLKQDQAAAPQRLVSATTPIVKRGALNVKRNAQMRIWAQLRRGYAPAYPASISYDVFVGPHRVVAEIGPDKDRAQGALGNLIEYGSTNNPPMPHLNPAGRDEQPRFESNLIRAAVRAMVSPVPPP